MGKACKSRSEKKVNEVSFSDTQDEAFFLGELTEVAIVQGQAQSSWKAEVVMNGQPTEFKVDTCGDVTVVLPSLHYSLKPTHVLNKASRLLMGSCKQKLNFPGTFIVELQVKDMLTKKRVYEIEDLEQPLLGREPTEYLKLISRLDSLSSNDYKSKVADKYPKLFQGLGVLMDCYHITLKEGAKLFQVTVPRKVLLPFYHKTKEESYRMLKSGVISKVDEPKSWCAPMMVVAPKKLNEYVKRENHPLPTVDTALERSAGSKVLSKLDASPGFWQIKPACESRPLTTSIPPWGQFSFNVLPFGCRSGYEKFQSYMNQILQALKGV